MAEREKILIQTLSLQFIKRWYMNKMVALVLLGSVSLISLIGCDNHSNITPKTSAELQQGLTQIQLERIEDMMIVRIKSELYQTIPTIRLENGGSIQTNITDMEQRIHDLEYRLKLISSNCKG